MDRAHLQSLNSQLMARLAQLEAEIVTRKRTEQELRQQQHHLEVLVDERTAELTAACRELHNFTYAASHDLKAPLGRICNFSALLERHYRDRLEGDGSLFLGFIRQNAERMATLIGALLEHVQLEQKITGQQSVEVRGVVQSVLRERAEEIRRAGAEVRLDLPDIAIRANPHGLAQIMSNLLDNALKFSTPNLPPRIAIGARIEDGGRCCLWVRDNGIGIDKAHHDRIFEIFRRLHTYSEYPGSGIGLALVKKAMECMGGRVWVESEPGQGAAFFLEFR